jgi:hypothetical protein
MSTNRYAALVIIALALVLPAGAPAAVDKWDNRCCRIGWALDLSGPRDYLPGIAQLNGEVKTAGKATGWYLTDEHGNAISKKAWVCRGNSIDSDGTYFNAYLDTRRLKDAGLYYWIVESKGRTRHRYAHPFRMPTRPITAYANKRFASRMRTRELPLGQPVKDALAGKPWTGGAGGARRSETSPGRPSETSPGRPSETSPRRRAQAPFGLQGELRPLR